MTSRRNGWSAWGFGLALGLGLAGTLITPVPAAENSSVLFMSDFEGGVLNDADKTRPSQGWKRAGTMPVITREEARVGSFSMKIYLNKNTSPTPYRTMVQTAWNTTTDTRYRTTPHAPLFKDSWVGFSVYLPSKGPGNWQRDSQTYEIIAQWHDAHDPFPPPGWDTEESKNPLWSLAVSQTSHRPAKHWNVNFLGESRTPYPTLGTPRPWKYETNDGFDAGSIDADLDKWTDWVVHIRWNFWPVGTRNNTSRMDPPYPSYENVAGSPTAGLIQVWKNGKLVIDRSPVQIGAHDNAGPALSMGLYKGWRSGPDRASDSIVDRTLYIDEVRYAEEDGSYAAVAPGGGKGEAPLQTSKPKPPSGIQLQQ